MLVLLLGFAACARVLPRLDDADPGWIVVDEWAGQWLCLLLVAPMFPSALVALPAAFLLFRLFDIVKPWPIRPLERLGPGWWAIMADDLAAAAMGAGAGWLLYSGWQIVGGGA